MPPFKDELVTSWITRNALDFGIKPSKLSTLLFDDTDAWKSDLDVYLNPDRVIKLSKNTGIPVESIRKQTFYHSCDFFYNQTAKTTQVKWVMPIGVRTRNKTYGIQYCPCCLAEDGERPYFRKIWRLGFMTCCTAHSVQLHDRCPTCQHPIEIKRPKKQDNVDLYHPKDIAHCSNCGFDFRKTKYKVVSKGEYEINRINFLQATLGYGKAGLIDFNYSNLYFEGIRRLLSFLVCSPKGEKLFLEIRNRLCLYQPYHRELIGHNVEPERLNIELRRTGMLMIFHLLQDWPLSFIRTCKANEITSHLIKTPYLEFPHWIANIFFYDLQKQKTYKSRNEKLSAIKYFKKTMKKSIEPSQVTRFINYYLKT